MQAAALGRGTRKGEKFPDKSHFTLFDSFDGTLFEYFRRATGITTEPPVQPSRTTAEIIEDIWRGRDREYNTRVLVKRLQGIAKEISGEARDASAGGGISDGDLARFAANLPAELLQNFADMELHRDGNFPTPPVAANTRRRHVSVAY